VRSQLSASMERNDLGIDSARVTLLDLYSHFAVAAPNVLHTFREFGPLRALALPIGPVRSMPQLARSRARS
jgi:hypothetical protein